MQGARPSAAFHPMPMAKKAGDAASVSLEALRAAALAAHSAAGLCRLARLAGAAKAARAGEGLLRAAIALASAPQEAPAAAAKEEGPPPTAKKPRRRKKKQQPMDIDLGKENEQQGSTLALATADLVSDCQPGGSVAVGDLTEFGLSAGALFVDPEASGSATSGGASVTSHVDSRPPGQGRAGAAAAAPHQRPGHRGPLHASARADKAALAACRSARPSSAEGAFRPQRRELVPAQAASRSAAEAAAEAGAEVLGNGGTAPAAAAAAAGAMSAWLHMRHQQVTLG